MGTINWIRHHKLIVALLIAAVFVVPTVWLRGKLPNQTAALVDVDTRDVQSLAVKPTIDMWSVSLERLEWEIEGQNVSAYNQGESLVVSGTYANESEPLFIARQTGLNINFSEQRYLHASFSSALDIAVSFHIGLPNLNSSRIESLLDENSTAITEIDSKDGIAWISLSYPRKGESIDEQVHDISFNIADKVAKLGLDDQILVGLQIRGHLIGLATQDKAFLTAAELLQFSKESPYETVSSSGQASSLTDGSAVNVIRKQAIPNAFDEYPYLQRVYVEYSLETFQNAQYTIFLMYKGPENLTAVRIGFIFVHDASNLLEIGTYIDWRRPLKLDPAFEPLFTMRSIMNEGDYAIVFTPVQGSRLETVQLGKIAFTYSKLPYSAFTTTTISEEILTVMSVFTVIVAGLIPTILLLVVFYMYTRNRLEDQKTTILGILILALALRLTLAPISAYPDDTQIFTQIGALYFGSGVFGAQWVSLPGYVYVETLAYLPYALLRAVGFQDFHFLALDIYSVEALFTKIPAIVSDFGSAYYLLKIARRFSPKHTVLAVGLYLLNPLTIYISAILGQFDSIFIFAIIAFTYYLVTDHGNSRAVMFSTFSAILNPVGIATMIQHAVTAGLRRKRWMLIRNLLLGIGIFSASLLPFVFEKNSPVLISSYERLRAGIPAERVLGQQVSFYLYGMRVTSSVGYGLTFRFLLEMLGVELGSWFYPYLAAIGFLAIVIIFTYKMRKALLKQADGLIYSGAFMLAVASLFQLTFPTIFDQFVVWIVGLLLVSFILCRIRRFLHIFMFISVSTGFLYVFAWRDYLPLISGVETVPLGSALLATLASILIGTAYSIILIAVLYAIMKTWIRNKNLSKD